VFLFYKIVSLLYYQLCLDIVASGTGFVLRPADVFYAKAKRQQQQAGDQLAVFARMR